MPQRLLRDLRHGLRSVLSDPLASLTVILSLGVGMGVTATAFSILNAMALKDLPGVVDQDRLVTFAIQFEAAEGQVRGSRFAWSDLEVLRSHREIFSGVAAAGPMQIAVDAGTGAELVDGELVSPDYFQVLGARPALGRFFGPGEVGSGSGSTGEPGVTVMSHRYWRSRFGEDPGILGRVLHVNGQPLRVVGVTGEGFTGMTPEDVIDGARVPQALWIPASMAETIRPYWTAPEPLGPEARWFMPVARLAPDVTLDGMVTALPALSREMEAAQPETRPQARLVHGDLIFGPGAGSWRPTVTVLGFMVVPLIVLLVSCANAANILLARNASRRRELAVRRALGAGRWDIFRQLLAESGILAVAAGAAGLVTALGARRIAALFSLHLSMGIPLDWRVFLFTLAASLSAGLLFGFVPALRVIRQDPGPGLGGSGRGASQGRGDSRLQDGLVVAQVALGLLLLVSSGLFVRSTQHGLTLDTGMEEDHLLLLSLDLDLLSYPPEEGQAFYRRLAESLKGTPGVEEVALADRPPLQGYPTVPVARAGDEAGYGPRLAVATVGAGFLEAVGIPLKTGRTLREADVEDGGNAVVLNEAAAQRLWPDQEALGRRIRIQEEDVVREVVGIVNDSRTTLYGQNEPIAYVPRPATYTPRATVYIRTSGDPDTSVDPVRSMVRRLDPRLPVRALEPAGKLRGSLLAPWRLGYLAMGCLGGIAVLLAGAGLYGVLAYAVSRRRREIGVRMALGADSTRVVRMIILRGLRLLGVGVAVGFPLAAAVATLLRGALFGVSPVDPWVYAQVGGLLLLVTVLAAFRPAWKAASVEPVRALSQ